MNSTCLTQTQLRAAADDEAGTRERAHLETCEACRARVAAARRDAETLASLAARLPVPASLDDEALRRMATAPAAARGATTLRPSPAFYPGRRRVWMTAAAMAAVVLLVVFAMPPVDTPRSISAAEILDRSLQSLAPRTGVEQREFDLELELPPVAAAYNGRYRIEQLEDYETGRFRVVRYAPNGTVLNAISDDPATRRRSVLIQLDGQPFAFRLTRAAGREMSLPGLARQHVEALIRLLQATAESTVREVQQDGAARYVVELPSASKPGAAQTGTPMVRLDRARAVIDAADYQLVGLEAAGAYLGEPFSMAFRLRNRQAWSSGEVPPQRFDLPDAPGAIELEGAGTHDVSHDMLALALREIVRTRR